MNSSPDADLAAFVLNSRYRRIVLETLAFHEQATPQEITDHTEDLRPHISRALSELRDKGIVELLVPEHEQIGRYYGLTDTGESVWEQAKSRIRPIEWSIIDPETSQQQALCDFATDHFGDALRFVGEHRDGMIELIFADQTILSSYTDEEIERSLRKFVFQLSLNDASLPIAELRSELKNYGEFVMIRVPISESLNVSLSVDGGTSIMFPEITDKIEEIYG